MTCRSCNRPVFCAFCEAIVDDAAITSEAGRINRAKRIAQGVGGRPKGAKDKTKRASRKREVPAHPEPAAQGIEW